MLKTGFAISICFLLCCFTAEINGQIDTTKFKYYDATYRLVKDIDDLRTPYFKSLDQFVYAANLENKQKIQYQVLRNRMHDSLSHAKYNTKNFTKELEQLLPMQEWQQAKKLVSKIVLTYNPRLGMLMKKKAIKSLSPIVIDSSSLIFELMAAIDPKENEVILDIGGALAEIDLVFAMLPYPLQIYVNDVDDYSKTNAFYKLLPSVNPKTAFLYIRGEDINTKCEHILANKILMINSFHHFSKKEKMLKSITKSMDATSELYFYELFKAPKNDIDHCDEIENRCKKRIDVKKCYRYLKEAGLDHRITKIGRCCSLIRAFLKN